MTTPDVSVILIAFNDVARLPRALESAQRQTLRNIEIIVIDDASTDGTAEFLAGVSDSRVRFQRLERNSGGCSAPRNAGLDMARGTWVMFCDSDDELEMHAAKNLLIAAEQADADMACGVAERVDVRTGKRRRWRSEHHQPGVIEDIVERPGLLFDTICVNKIYRRSWLGSTRFVDGLLYEDQLFTLQCYLRAGRIAIIDPTVYYWYVEKLSESITQRRDEHRNIGNRIAINKLMDAELSARPELKSIKDQKFLAHETYLYLRTIERLADSEARALLAPLVTYLETVDLSAARDLRPALRVAIYHLLRDDLAGVRRALRNIAWSAVIDVPIVTRAGRDYWGCADLQSGPAIGGHPPDWWLDISELRASSAPIPQQRPCHVVTSLTARSIEGSTIDAYGNGSRIEDIALVWIAPGNRIIDRYPLTWEVRSGQILWGGAFSVPQLRGRSAHLALEMRIDARLNHTAVRWEGVLPESMAAGEFGTIRWRDDRQRASLGTRIMRRVAAYLPRTPALVFDGHDWGASASLSVLLAEQAPDIPQYWLDGPGAPNAPATARSIDRAGVRIRRLRPLTVDPPLTVIAAHMAQIDVASVRHRLDLKGRVVTYLPMGEPAADWLEWASEMSGQLLVQRLDGEPVQVPAAMRAWVTDVRGMCVAEMLALADSCVTDSATLATFVRELGIPVTAGLTDDAAARLPVPEALIRAGEHAVQGIIDGLRT